MKVLQLDSVGGASGDLILGALVELGVDPAWLERELRTLQVGDFHIVAKAFSSHGLNGTQVTVDIHEPHRRHGAEHGHHAHAHGRTLPDVEALIQHSGLPEAVKAMGARVFGRLADAEARVHRKDRKDIHFHEVGAVDSIVDILGCCLGLHALGVEAVCVGPLPQGRGTVRCAHGVYPNPAPATIELLKGFAIAQTEEPFELVTPTGAALLAEWRNLETPPIGVRVLKAGHSFGHHRLEDRPNLLRAVLLETADAPGEDICLVLECNIDDATPEVIGALTGRLLEGGALDAFTTPVQMKKQRPGTLLTVLARPVDRDRLVDMIFRESTTFGIREHVTRRSVLERRMVTVETEFGAVRMKIGRWKGEDVTSSPEFEDCHRLANERGVPVRRVYDAAVQALHRAG
jgi:hypothetical protein